MLHRFERREEDGSRQQYLLPGVVETLTDPCTSKMCQKREGVPVPERRRDRERRSLPAANFSILEFLIKVSPKPTIKSEQCGQVRPTIPSTSSSLYLHPDPMEIPSGLVCASCKLQTT